MLQYCVVDVEPPGGITGSTNRIGNCVMSSTPYYGVWQYDQYWHLRKPLNYWAYPIKVIWQCPISIGNHLRLLVNPYALEISKGTLKIYIFLIIPQNTANYFDNCALQSTLDFLRIHLSGRVKDWDDGIYLLRLFISSTTQQLNVAKYHFTI